MQYCTVAAGGVGTGEVHGVGTASGGTLADVAVVAQGEKHEVYSRLAIHPLRVVLLLMGMTITVNGYILKSRWMVWCGIVGGIGGFIWESFYVTQTLTGWLVYYTNAHYVGVAHGIIPAIIVTILAFIGLTLPGMKLKNS